ncbi:rhodopsin-like [Actinia tenebrosa]|uniref:Rhodopsin-like n=1 Tax=Actinia tenebrosa TaxID=6105 RepID=A0A6P8I1M6_ACTTE|nr:rhodopsin-like [Actinia tenebrosa]XP_031561411.1 rhodopsin-like [Actinia tenebrosa]XP_031561412.1 rhodopsin-like [Actinia tenebrosa]
MNSKPLSPTGYAFVTCYLGILLVAGVISQIITIKVLLVKDNRNKHLTPYLLNIVASNAIIILGSFPTTFLSSLNNGWYFGDAVCRLDGLLTGIGFTAMIATMTYITIKIYLIAKNQYLVINAETPVQCGRPYMKILIAIWVYSIIAIMPPVVGLTNMVLEAAKTNCVPDWAPKRVPDKIYIVGLTLVAYVLPVSVSFVYLWKTRLIISLHINLMNDRFMNLKLGNLKNIYRMSAFAVSFFAIAWLPYGLYVFISVISGKEDFGVEATLVPALTAKSSVVVNPFIYAVVLPKFRHSILKILGLRRRSGGSNSMRSFVHEPVTEMETLRSAGVTRANSRARGNVCKCGKVF